MHQEKCEGEGELSEGVGDVTKGSKDSTYKVSEGVGDVTKGSKDRTYKKEMPKTPPTFGGMKKGFLAFGSTKPSPSSQQKTPEVIGKTPSHAKSTNEIDELADIEYKVIREGNSGQETGDAWKACKKYPDHDGFIPVLEFCLDHLPQRFQTEEYLDYIKTWADLTVRLRVNTSPNRPKDDQFAKCKSFNGTAYVETALPVVTGCFCRVCKKHGYKDKKWWRIGLHSATHCVFDEKEAEDVKIDFFYDSEELRKGGKMKTLYGVQMVCASRHEDSCSMACATHDEDLGKFLKQRRGHITKSDLVFEPTPSSRNAAASASDTKTMVCISHPHGRPKQVTVGELRKKYDLTYIDSDQAERMATWRSQNGFHRYLLDYTTKSCPGSSGGKVICLDDLTSDNESVRILSSCIHQRSDQACDQDDSILNTGFWDYFQSYEKILSWLMQTCVNKKDLKNPEDRGISAWYDY